MDVCNGSDFAHNNSGCLSYSLDAGLPACIYGIHIYLGSKISLSHIVQGGQLSSTVIAIAQFLLQKVQFIKGCKKGSSDSGRFGTSKHGTNPTTYTSST